MKRSVCLLLVLLCVGAGVSAQEEEARGLALNSAGAFEGYNLFAPLNAATTYLIDNAGRVVHTWESGYRPGNSAYLLDTGSLMRGASFGHDGNGTFHGGGAGFRVEEFSWEGERTWEFIYAKKDGYLMHHDIQPMPNGNVLILAWEMKTAAEAVAAGRDPELLEDGVLWPEHVIEVTPIRPEGAKIVWEWHLWDHVVQDFDETKLNFGDVAAHPELVELNPLGHWMDRISDEEMETLEALGYIEADDAKDGEDDEDGEDDGDDRRRGRGSGADWMHSNAINYNPILDQIAISALGNSEIWVIDHSTTTEEARGHTGGRTGKGGDLLYRWGNPFAYRAGTEEDQQLFSQHDIRWIPEGRPGAGNFLVFNNGRGRSEDSEYSSVVEFAAPLNADGTYRIEPGEAFGPKAPTWEYTAPNNEDFHSGHISGAERLANGNTIICEGASGTFFEVTPDKEMVWRYLNPVAMSRNPGEEKEEEDEEPGVDVFRVNRYAPDHPAFAGKTLIVGPPLVDYIASHPPKVPRERGENETGD